MRVAMEQQPADGPMLEGVGQIALTVRDLGRAKAFFGGVLGLAHLFDAGPLAFYQAGAVRLMLSAGEGGGSGEGTVVYFWVGDLQRAYRELRGRGAQFADEPHLIAKMPDHDLWMVILKDDDGHVFGLMSKVRETGRGEGR